MRIIITLLAILLSTVSFGRNTINTYSIHQALTSPKAMDAALGNSVRFYFGNQPHPPILRNLDTVSTSNKTNAFGKSDYTACQWVFLSALKSLRNAALDRGGNAVINIKSNYQNNLVKSDTHFTCGAGGLIAGVALTGTVVELKG